MQTLKWVTIAGVLGFLYLAVYNYIAFRKARKRKSIQDIKKIIATGKPETVPANQVPIQALSRRARRSTKRIEQKQKKHLDGAALVSKIKQDRDRIRQGEIIDANEFLHILKQKENGKNKKA